MFVMIGKGTRLNMQIFVFDKNSARDQFLVRCDKDEAAILSQSLDLVTTPQGGHLAGADMAKGQQLASEMRAAVAQQS